MHKSDRPHISIQFIDDVHDPRLAMYANIKEKDLVGRQSRFIAEGKVVLRVLLGSSQFEAESLLISKNKIDGLTDLLSLCPPDVPIYCVTSGVMDEIAGFNVHRGILAVGKKKQSAALQRYIVQSPASSSSQSPYKDRQASAERTQSFAEQPDLAATSRLTLSASVPIEAQENSFTAHLSSLLNQRPKQSLIVALCGISNHDNIGSIFRNAASFNADCVLLDETCCDPLYRKAIRVSVGATLQVPYLQQGSIEEIVAALCDSGYNLLALSPAGTFSIYDIAPTDRLALLLGTEGEGLPKHLLSSLQTARIPMSADFDSLNVATASGIVLSRFFQAI